MLILVGPSASGKTQIVHELVKHKLLNKLVTYTSRNKRVGEVDGIDYHFLDKEAFEKKINEGFFLEYVSYNNNYYGTSFNEIGDDKVVILEPNGLKTYVSKIKKDLFIIFLKCDESILKERMTLRGDSLESIKARLELDKQVFNDDVAKLADYVLDSTGKCVNESTALVYNKYQEFLKKRDK